MSLDLTRQSLLKTLIYFVFLAVIFWGAEFVHPLRSGIAAAAHGEQITAPPAGTPLGTLIDHWIGYVPGIGVLLSSLLVFVNSFFVTRVVIRNVIFLERTYMPAIIYLLVCSGYYNSYMSFRPLLVALLVLTAVEIIFKSYNCKTLATGSYLTVGFIIGTAGAIYVPALLLAGLIPVGLVLFRLFDIREWIAAFGGWAMPLFFSAYGVWITGGDFTDVISEYRQALTTPLTLPPASLFSSFEWTFIGCIAVLFVLSIVTFLGRRRSYKLKPFKVYIFFIWMLAIAALILAFVPCRSLYQLPILAVPLAVIIPTYFNSRKPNFVSNFLYVLMMGCAVVIHLLPFFL